MNIAFFGWEIQDRAKGGGVLRALLGYALTSHESLLKKYNESLKISRRSTERF